MFLSTLPKSLAVLLYLFHLKRTSLGYYAVVYKVFTVVCYRIIITVAEFLPCALHTVPPWHSFIAVINHVNTRTSLSGQFLKVFYVHVLNGRIVFVFFAVRSPEVNNLVVTTINTMMRKAQRIERFVKKQMVTQFVCFGYVFIMDFGVVHGLRV